jgi:hypothetical protein
VYRCLFTASTGWLSKSLATASMKCLSANSRNMLSDELVTRRHPYPGSRCALRPWDRRHRHCAAGPRGCGGMNRPRALSVPSTLDGFDHAPQRIGREPPLDQAHERLTRPGQWVGRGGAVNGLRSIRKPWSTYRPPRPAPSSPTFILPLYSSTPSSEPSCSSLILR